MTTPHDGLTALSLFAHLLVARDREDLFNLVFIADGNATSGKGGQHG